MAFGYSARQFTVNAPSYVTHVPAVSLRRRPPWCSAVRLLLV